MSAYPSFYVPTTTGRWSVWHTLPKALSYLRPYRGLAILSIVVTILGAAAGLAEPWPLAIMVDNVLGHKGPAGPVLWLFGTHPPQVTLLIVAVLAGFTIAFFTHGLGVLGTWFIAKIEQRVILDFRCDLFKHAQSLSLTYHDSRATGQLIYQINLHAAALGQILVAIPPIAQAALSLIGMFVVVMVIDWQLGLVSLIAVPFIWYSLGLYGKKIVPYLQRVQGLEWESLSIVYEAVTMLRVIVSFGRERHEFNRFRTQGKEAVEQRIKLTLRQTLFSLAVTMATAIGTSTVLGFGAWHVIQGKITIGELLVLMSYIASVYQPLEQLGTTVGNLNDQFVMFNTGLHLLDVEPEVVEAPDAVALERCTGRVAFEDVNFAYAGREGTLKNISFEVEPAQRVAIVGPTGAGKSTLINLLVRFYEPQGGRILVDGIDVQKLKMHSLRENISMVHQEPLLFSGTIEDNIRYGRLDATREEVIAAAKAANAHEFVESLPDGYQTVLGEKGAQLSGGERQRIAVARAFIKDAPILILDEPTSSIDSKTESVILDALDDLMEGRTSFMIAHRLSTIRDADLIVVLNHGEIVEMGSHDELVAKDGLYRQLYVAQTQSRRRRRVTADGRVIDPSDFDAALQPQAQTQEEAIALPPERPLPRPPHVPSPPLLHLGGEPSLRLAQRLAAVLGSVALEARPPGGNGHGNGNGNGNGAGRGDEAE